MLLRAARVPGNSATPWVSSNVNRVRLSFVLFLLPPALRFFLRCVLYLRPTSQPFPRSSWQQRVQHKVIAALCTLDESCFIGPSSRSFLTCAVFLKPVHDIKCLSGEQKTKNKHHSLHQVFVEQEQCVRIGMINIFMYPT